MLCPFVMCLPLSFFGSSFFPRSAQKQVSKPHLSKPVCPSIPPPLLGRLPKHRVPWGRNNWRGQLVTPQPSHTASGLTSFHHLISGSSRTSLLPETSVGLEGMVYQTHAVTTEGHQPQPQGPLTPATNPRGLASPLPAGCHPLLLL